MGSDIKNGDKSVSRMIDYVDAHYLNVTAHVHQAEFTTTATEHSGACVICGADIIGAHTYGNSTVTETAGVVN